jgi:hypothetical protein
VSGLPNDSERARGCEKAEGFNEEAMSAERRLSDDEAILAELWFRDYERVGTFSAKARELRVDRNTLRDAIRRVRGQLTKNVRQKLTAIEIDQLATELLAGTHHVEPHQTGEEHFPHKDTE